MYLFDIVVAKQPAGGAAYAGWRAFDRPQQRVFFVQGLRRYRRRRRWGMHRVTPARSSFTKAGEVGPPLRYSPRAFKHRPQSAGGEAGGVRLP